VTRIHFVTALALWFVLRIGLGLLPGYPSDVVQIKSWALSSAVHGPAAIYETSTYDYPPVFSYLIYPLGKLYLALHPEIGAAEMTRGEGDLLRFRSSDGTLYRHPSFPRARSGVSSRPRFESLPGSQGFSLLVKLPGLFFDLVIAAVLFRLVSSGGTWGPTRTSPRWGRLAAAAWLWNPALLWNSGYWGMPDPIHGAFALVAVTSLGVARWGKSGAAMAIAVLMKPLAAPLVPLWVWVIAARSGGPGLARGLGAAVGATSLVFWPFFVWGDGPTVVARVFADLSAMPFTSINAHNLWLFIGPWKPTSTPLFLGLSSGVIGPGLALAAIFVLLFVNRTWLVGGREEDRVDPKIFTGRLLVVASAIAGSFFLVSTHMHENHLFTAIPFITAVAGRDRRLAWLTVGLSGAFFFNLVLHDPSLGMPVRNGGEFWSLHRLVTSANACGVTATVVYLYRTAWRVRSII